MNTWIWRLTQWARYLGGAGLVGLGLLAAALLVQGAEVTSREHAIAAQRDALSTLRKTAAASAVVPPPANPLSALPPTGTASQQIGELEQLARQHGLTLPRGQYSVSPATGTDLARWQLVLPVEAAYPALHAFLAAALERLPNLTLDELKLTRERIDTEQLQAELRMSLFVEAAP